MNNKWLFSLAALVLLVLFVLYQTNLINFTWQSITITGAAIVGPVKLFISSFTSGNGLGAMKGKFEELNEQKMEGLNKKIQILSSRVDKLEGK